MSYLAHIIPPPEGRALRNDQGNFDYEYFLKDHLGNTRVSFNQKGIILQDNRYYPFCMGLGEALTYVDNTATENKYLYNGKEMQDDFGLGWYDYGARMYDPTIGRFTGVDPLADEFYELSPFNYASSSPIVNIDLWGLQAWDINNEWDEKTIAKYQEYVAGRINEYIENDEKFTCEDLAANLLIDFASENGLPVSFSNESGLILDAGNEAYDNIEDFRNDVLETTGANDLVNTSVEQDKNDMRKGDLLLHSNEETGRVNHTQVVTYSDNDVVRIFQGNLKGRIFSSNPKNILYGGTAIQRGVYNKQTGNYIREGSKTKGLYKSKNVSGRRWNFSLFNFKQQVYSK